MNKTEYFFVTSKTLFAYFSLNKFLKKRSSNFGNYDFLVAAFFREKDEFLNRQF